jgi:hypothetical protein
VRFLFRELFKRVRFRYAILILLILFVFSYAFQYAMNVILISKNEFPLDKSPNPQATEHFIKAMEYRNYISHVHNFIDYDNFLMKPLFNKMNEEYEKGKSLLPKTSAEDVYWYVILYRGIYGIGGIPDDYDMSMAFKTTLTKEEYKKHYEEIVDKIKRLAINDFNYDVPRVTEYKFDFMDDLLSELFFSAIGKLENFEKQEMYDEDHLKNLIYIYTIYKKFSNKYLPLAKQKLSKEFHIYNEIKFLYKIIALKAYQNNNQSLNCFDNENLILIDRLKELSTSKDKDIAFKYIFDGNSWVLAIVKKLRVCINLEKQVNEVFINFIDRNKD